MRYFLKELVILTLFFSTTLVVGGYGLYSLTHTAILENRAIMLETNIIEGMRASYWTNSNRYNAHYQKVYEHYTAQHPDRKAFLDSQIYGEDSLLKNTQHNIQNIYHKFEGGE